MLLAIYKAILSARGVNMYEEDAKVDEIDFAETDTTADNKDASGGAAEGTVNKEKDKKPKGILSIFKKGKSKRGDKPNEEGKDIEMEDNKKKKKEKPKILKDWKELGLPDERKYIRFL